MMRQYYILFLLTLFLIPGGCKKETVEVYNPPEDQSVLFEYRYVNHAWSYTELGWFIDSKGDVHYYSYPEDFRLPDSTFYISQEDLLYNLAQADSSIHGLEPEDLEYYTGLIAGAAEGWIGEVESVAADAGNSVLSCYKYDANRDMYRYVFLASSGDWQRSNESEEAEILVEWLREFGVFWLVR